MRACIVQRTELPWSLTLLAVLEGARWLPGLRVLEPRCLHGVVLADTPCCACRSAQSVL